MDETLTAAPPGRSATTERGSTWTRLSDALPAVATPPSLGDEFDSLPTQDTPTDDRLYCGTCRGFRWLRLDRQLGHPEFGEIRRCPDCLDVGLAERRSRAAERAGLGKEERTKTFANFKPVRGSAAAVKAASDFARNPHGWLVIHGRAGAGKTHLGLAIANALALQERDVRWWYGPDLVAESQRLIATHQQNDFLKSLQEVGVLIVDDLAAVRATDYAWGQILEPLMAVRYRLKAATVFTCIGNPEEITAEVNEAIGRRMLDADICRAVENTAPMWRGVGLL